MPIPNAQTAYVPREKLADYLLNEQHPVGRSKARWFRSLGFNPADPADLEQALLELVQTSEDYVEASSPFGTKYVVLGTIPTPSGDVANLTTVWIVKRSDNRPRLVTAYPGDKS